MNNKKLENELYYNWISNIEFKSELTKKVKICKAKRFETQKQIAELLHLSLTKIKQIENGTCKDFNAILAYINYFDYTLKII